MIIEKPRVAGARPGFADIARFDLAFPLWVQQVPVRMKFLFIDGFAVVIDRTVSRRADVVENILRFRIGILMRLQIPFGLIADLRQNKAGLIGSSTFAR